MLLAPPNLIIHTIRRPIPPYHIPASKSRPSNKIYPNPYAIHPSISLFNKTNKPSIVLLLPPLQASDPKAPRHPPPSRAMVEGHAQTWTTRRGSNPRLEAEQLIDIPATPTSEVRNNNSINGILSPNLTTAVIIASWYLSNIGVLLLNKYLLSIYGYRYPIFLTLLHMLSCALYSILAIHWLELVPYQPIVSRRQFFKIAALSAIFCFSVVCGNTSLRYLPVSFNQMIGATTPFFTAIFAFIITCKKESREVYLTLVPVVLGIVLASNSEPLFHLFGFLVCVGSTAGRALKSVVQGILLTSEGERLHSMNLLMYMAPMAAVILLPFSLYVEGNVASVTVRKAREDSFILFLLVGNATVAYLVNLTNFLVTKHTSALTLQVLGNAKAAVAAVVSVLIFRNPVTVMGMTGFGVTIMGVVLYSEAKKRSH
ncbi:probable sugar phosphate/phosphate translocator At1g12500 [Magnolia sinica]|uniref:probable sugar phosphate/phosphate translocator At1g12500 n=1 Tax=Magnolia sinica TaxID=86752 RepID=UPI00265A6AC1|nr:probable sugar phosphate/phosphate translocator At1g12500 [Magnolia sinica]XP_058086594.1 probable sugar phosphate/phosphate translocator At1g12500 [Magnolia sinica]XP_058086595.1 probable sugar phosphate/phosphate translocator At1g12500 [Magnolia sinica]XP_058086596.1 probable sugar phosphate/phosphate translocator At1g12500 [Magnolia sinica]